MSWRCMLFSFRKRGQSKVIWTVLTLFIVVFAIAIIGVLIINNSHKTEDSLVIQSCKNTYLFDDAAFKRCVIEGLGIEKASRLFGNENIEDYNDGGGVSADGGVDEGDGPPRPPTLISSYIKSVHKFKSPENVKILSAPDGNPCVAFKSDGNINTTGYDGKSAGLVHLTVETANNFKSSCGVADTITLDWLKKPENAEKQICIAIERLKSLVSGCGCDVRQLAAGYNGGEDACLQSANCGSAAKADGGECIVCQGESFTRK